MWVEEGRGRVLQFTGRCLSTTKSRFARQAEARGRAAEGKQLAGLTSKLRIYVVWCLNGDLTEHVLLACTVLHKRVIIDEINIFAQVVFSPKSYKRLYLSIKLGC